MDELQ